MTAVPPDKKDQYETAVELFVSMASLPPNDPSREKITTSIIELCLPLATHVARRYQGRGQPFEDLEQVARVGSYRPCSDSTSTKDRISCRSPSRPSWVRYASIFAITAGPCECLVAFRNGTLPQPGAHDFVPDARPCTDSRGTRQGTRHRTGRGRTRFDRR